jgi:hypothetical protein
MATTTSDMRVSHFLKIGHGENSYQLSAVSYQLMECCCELCCSAPFVRKQLLASSRLLGLRGGISSTARLFRIAANLNFPMPWPRAAS